MNFSDMPRKLPVVWASAADGSYVHSVPDAGTTNDSGASFQQGFPPKTFQPVGSGGVPVDGGDMNGALSALSAWARWVSGGGSVSFDTAYVNSVGGYPKGAKLLATSNSGIFWLCTLDGNTSNPDNGGQGWLAFPSMFTTGTNGYRVGSDGFIEQWGGVSLPSGGAANVGFPIAFPNACLNVQATNNAGGPPTAWPGASNLTKSGFSIYSAQSAGVAPSAAGVSHSWRAIGY